jgi:hypothetical protein
MSAMLAEHSGRVGKNLKAVNFRFVARKPEKPQLAAALQKRPPRTVAATTVTAERRHKAGARQEREKDNAEIPWRGDTLENGYFGM